MPIFGQKNVNSVKTTLYYGPTKSIGCPFFPICHEKITALMPIFGQKNVLSLEKKLCSHAHILSAKTSILSKTLCSQAIFSHFFIKSSSCHAQIWSKRRQFCQNHIRNYMDYTPKKSIGCPFFPIFHEKITALIPIFCQYNS